MSQLGNAAIFQTFIKNSDKLSKVLLVKTTEYDT